jgi:glutamate synthase (NADPH/NADH) small chain
MEFLTQQNKRNAGDDEVRAAPRGTLSAKGKHVIVIGGGDTGSDCVGTSNRQGAASVTQLEIMPKPPEHEDKALTWPDWPVKLRTSSSHEEGAERDWSVLTKRVIGANGDVTGLECVRIEWDGRNFSEVEGSEFILKADLIFLAMGFVGPKRRGMLDRAGVKLDDRGNVAANVTDYATSEDNVFACGDMRRGQSLVVWAIREGRQAARSVDEALMGVSELPR